MRLKIESLQLSAITFIYVFFLFWSCIDGSAPASVCHSFHENCLSFGRSSEHGAWNLSHQTTYQLCNTMQNLDKKHGCSFQHLSQSYNLLRLLKCFKVVPTIPPTDALPTYGRFDPKLPEVLLPQPYLPPNNFWVKCMIKAQIKSRFII